MNGPLNHEALNGALAEFRAELRSRADEMRVDLRERFNHVDECLAGVNNHLKELNGRTVTSERRLDRHEERLKTLFRRAFGRRQEDRGDEDGGNRRITQRDLAMVLATLGIEGAVILFVKEVWPAIQKVLQ